MPPPFDALYGRPVHKVRHAIFCQFLPLFPCHTLSHIPGPPKSTSHISDPPFLVDQVQKIPTKAPCTNSLNCSRGLLSRGFCSGFLSGRFCPWWFLSVPPSVRIHLLQQKVKDHLKFHVSYV